MNEIFDQVLIQIIFAIYLCLIIFLYKYAHGFLYPINKNKLHRRFVPTKNTSETLHLLSRVLGVCIIFSSFEIGLEQGILFALLDIFLLGAVSLTLFIVSIYILESIVMYNFEYIDEIEKKKNIAYSLISVAHTLGLAFIISTALKHSLGSLTFLAFSWLFSIVIIGFLAKGFSFYSKLPFNRLMIQKDSSTSFSYFGYFLGWSLIISSALNHPLHDIKWYGVTALLKVLLALILIPIFLKLLIIIFNIQDDYESTNEVDKTTETEQKTLSYGIYEGTIFICSCFLTIVISEQIHFGTFYPTL